MSGIDISPVNIAAQNALNGLSERLPSLAASALILILGWGVALVARAVVRRVFRSGDRIFQRTFLHGARAGSEASRAASLLLGDIAYWAAIILTVAVAVEVAGFSAIADWLKGVVAHLPNLAGGAAIIVVGYVIGVLVGGQVSSAAQAARLHQGPLLGRLAQGAIFITALIIGLRQIGVDVTLLVALFIVVVGAILVGFSIAFGLGARDFVSDLISARAARRELQPGLSVRIGDREGLVLEITATQIVLDTPAGRALVPARLAAADGCLILDAPPARLSDSG